MMLVQEINLEARTVIPQRKKIAESTSQSISKLSPPVFQLYLAIYIEVKTMFSSSYLGTQPPINHPYAVPRGHT